MKAFLKNKGFTLVELMIVIVIVGILAAVAIPKFNIAADKARASEFPTILAAVFTNQEAFKAETGTYALANDFVAISMENPTSTSKWFGYSFTYDAGSAYIAQSSVKAKFGDLAGGETATITHAGTRSCVTGLQKYAPQWK